MELSKKQIKQLRGIAHHLKPLIIIGKNDITEPLVTQTNETLEQRELIKCQVLEGSGLTSREAAEELSEATDSNIVQIIGKRFVLFRRSKRTDIEHISLVRE